MDRYGYTLKKNITEEIVECRYHETDLRFYDGIKIPYHPSIVGTNVLVVSGDKRICAILNVEQLGVDRSCLYLTKAAGTPCQESDVKHYNLYCPVLWRRFMKIGKYYSIIKLTGQSCKVELFREFVAGKMIQFKRKAGDISGDYELKMDCVD